MPIELTTVGGTPTTGGGGGEQNAEGANKEFPQNDKENDEYGEERVARKNRSGGPNLSTLIFGGAEGERFGAIRETFNDPGDRVVDFGVRAHGRQPRNWEHTNVS